MYIDETIVAGLIVVVATIGFFGGCAYFVYNDLKQHKKN